MKLYQGVSPEHRKKFVILLTPILPYDCSSRITPTLTIETNLTVGFAPYDFGGIERCIACSFMEATFGFIMVHFDQMSRSV